MGTKTIELGTSQAMINKAGQYWTNIVSVTRIHIPNIDKQSDYGYQNNYIRDPKPR